MFFIPKFRRKEGKIYGLHILQIKFMRLFEKRVSLSCKFFLHESCKNTDNSRNGYTPKTLKSEFEEVEVQVPRDRKGEFEPKIVPKYQRNVSGIEEKVISLYARGMSTWDIGV